MGSQPLHRSLELPLQVTSDSVPDPPMSNMPEESHVDVLIVGAGPAGLMCGNALAAAGIHVKILDQR